MYIHVDLKADPPSLSLEEPQDCARLYVEVVEGSDLGSLHALLVAEGVGRVEDDDHAWISVVALRSLAESRVDEKWAEDFKKMLAYANGQGWLTADGAEVRAHLELVAW
jgi:hypothetical protein